MGSSFTWLDHSDRERRRFLDAIDQFKDATTRDELGLGTIRDTFADRFFPGTSVLQTRARYFLFIPWLYRVFEAKGITPDATSKMRREEVALIDVLAASDDWQGTIGRVARATLKRLPSNIYWLGLERWGIRLSHSSQDDYHALLARSGGAQVDRDDDGQPLATDATQTWHGSLPPMPEGFPKAAEFALTRREGRYLCEQLRQHIGDTLLGFLADRGRPANCDYAWEHPQFAEFTNEMQGELAHAQCLAETTQSAMLLYNLMLVEEQVRPERDQRIAEVRTYIKAWREELKPRTARLASWDRQSFWTMIGTWSNVRTLTKSFVDAWVDLAPWSTAFEDNEVARKLVRAREQQLKGARARLGSPAVVELWGGASALGRMDYRWNASKRLLADIYKSLGRGSDAGTT